jgi:small subunit ribosomal protein S17
MPRRVMQGRVVSDKMDKTVTVLVERRYMHPIYKKYIRKSDKFAAHDETNAFRIGDMVEIEECRPLSKNKTWKVITDPASVSHPEKKSAAPAAAVAETGAKKKPSAAKKKKA